LLENKDHWLANEVLQFWKRVLKRIDLTSRSLVALVEHGSCYTGILAELLFSVDRSYMMEDEFEDDDRAMATITLSKANFGLFPMSNDLTRLQTRFLGDPVKVDTLQVKVGVALDASAADELGLVTYAFDDVDWEDEVRIFMEERASFSPDAMTAMEANLRFAGPETMETRIFGRLTAWQNWVFQRPNAVGQEGALQRYGTGMRGKYEEAAAFTLFEAGDIISELGPESFNSKKSAIELTNEIEAVFMMMSKGLLIEALVVLESDILEKTDGCANIGEPDRDDWITSFEAQALVYPLVVETIELLGILVE